VTGVLKKNDHIISRRIYQAKTFTKRLVGLMFRSSLDKEEGLYLSDCRAIHTSFMRFNIDVVFVDRNFRVVRIIENMKPWRATLPVLKASGVIELPGGMVERESLKEGDVILLELNE